MPAMLILINNFLDNLPVLINGKATKKTIPAKRPACTHLSKYISSKKLAVGTSSPGIRNRILAMMNQVNAGRNCIGFNFIWAQI
jgi:hypothetical protein